MKAVIMAGGEGTRLRPVSILRPKPMVKLMDKPVSEYIVQLLKKNGIRDICMTLRYLPQVVLDYFGDGSEFGVNIEYQVEKEPLGTAGGVRACRKFIGEDDFIVISGDAVCDFDLEKCIEFHRRKNSKATIILCQRDEPLEYGLVLTDSSDRVTQFVEKPSWDKVLTDSVNTGIYILSPEILERIPKGVSYDFGRDLFPQLLNDNIPIYAVTAEGYWCDIGNCRAYLECNFDALDEKIAFDFGKQVISGVWSHSRLPESVSVHPPCYIGHGVTIEDEAVIGPYAVLCKGTHIGKGAKIERCVIDGADIGPGAELTSATICRGARIGKDALVSEGCVVGDGAVVGNGAFLAEGVRVWPQKHIDEGGRVLISVIHGTARSSALLFQGRLAGEIGSDLSFENCISIGSALSGYGRVIISSSGTPAAMAAVNALKCGICSGGGEVWESERSFEAATAFAARYYDMAASVYVRHNGPSLVLSFFGKDGRPFTRSEERRIEAAMNGDTVRAPHNRIGAVRFLPDTVDSYTLSAVKQAFFRSRLLCKTPVYVFGDSIASITLRRVLSVLGCTAAKRKEDGICFQISDDGFSLIAEEGGTIVYPPQLSVMLALLEFEIGSGRVAILPSAPTAIELLAESLGGKVLKVGKIKNAESLLSQQTFMYDGIFAAARLVAGLAAKNETLSHLAERTPRFYISHRSVPIRRSRGAVMRELINSCSEMSIELAEGLDISLNEGRIRISPLASSALKITTECESESSAMALCDQFEDLVRNIDNSE